MKTIALLALLLAPPKIDSVYLCMGSMSHSYHIITNCKGLEKCSTKLNKVSLLDASNKFKRTACGYCKNKK